MMNFHDVFRRHNTDPISSLKDSIIKDVDYIKTIPHEDSVDLAATLISISQLIYELDDVDMKKQIIKNLTITLLNDIDCVER